MRTVDPEDPYPSLDCECLGLVKSEASGDCVLAISSADDCNPHPCDPDEPMDWKPILDCSVEERVQAAPHIAKLREEIVASAEQYICKVDEAVAHLTTELEHS